MRFFVDVKPHPKTKQTTTTTTKLRGCVIEEVDSGSRP